MILHLHKEKKRLAMPELLHMAKVEIWNLVLVLMLYTLNILNAVEKKIRHGLLSVTAHGLKHFRIYYMGVKLAASRSHHVMYCSVFSFMELGWA